MADDVLRMERRARIAILTLNRPDRLNALNVALRQALTHACQELRDDDNIWAVVLTGAGHGFCSGVDLRTPRADSESAPSRQTPGGSHGAGSVHCLLAPCCHASGTAHPATEHGSNARRAAPS